MALAAILTILVTTTVALITYQLTRRQAQLQTVTLNRELADAKTELLIARADFDARQEELRRAIDEARQRENEAKLNAKESETRLSEIALQLRVAVEEKGRFQK